MRFLERKKSEFTSSALGGRLRPRVVLVGGPLQQRHALLPKKILRAYREVAM